MKLHRAFTCLSALILAAVASTAAAQDSDDFSFAKRLAYRGWYDLADYVCARIEKDNSLPRDVRSALPILRAEIELAKADREADPDKALKYISESIARLQSFIAEETNHPRILEAHINIGFLKMRKAKALVDQMGGARAAADHDRLKREAIGLYQEVTNEFDELIARWKRLPASEEVSGAIMDARLEADRARYEHAKIPGLGEEERKKLLNDAVKNLVDFEFDYGNTAKGFEGMLLEGRCLFELGEYAQAETKLKNTLAIISILKKNDIPRNAYFNQIIYGTYLTLAQLYLKTNRPKDARAFIDGVFISDAAAERDWIGLALKVEKVEALFRVKEPVLAKQLADKVIEADTNGPFAGPMREKLEKYGRVSGRLDPDAAIKGAENSMEKGRLRDALSNLRQAIENSKTDEVRAKIVPRALFLMGQCLADLRRPYEAAIVYEKVFTQFPKHDLGVKACWEAIVCYSNEFDTFEDPADEREKDRLMQTLLDRWKDAKEADNIPYLQGLKLENAKKFKDAAEKYLTVPERAPAFERALVRGAYCLRVDAFRQFSDFVKQGKKDPAVQKAILDQLNRTEELFKKFLKRVETIPTDTQEVARDRAQLVLVVNQEMAFLYNHELVGKAEESLKFLEKVAKDMPPDDERMAKIHYLQIQSQLVLLKNDEAVKTLEMMFDRFPHSKETAQACKSVAIRLDEITSDLMKPENVAKSDPKVIEENLKKICRYYDKWLKGAMAFTMDVRVNDVMSVAQTLYMAAKRLNAIPDTVGSFMDMKKGIVGWKNYFEDAEFVHSLLLDRFKDKIPEKERLNLMIRRARCLSFISDNAENWLRAKTAYEEIVKAFNIKGPAGFVPAALVGNPLLVGPYIEMGAVYAELGRWQKIHYDNAISTFGDIANIAASGSEPWWIARFMSLQCHYLRGKDKDILTAQIAIKQIQANYPDFDGGKYGLKERFIELQKKIETGR